MCHAFATGQAARLHEVEDGLPELRVVANEELIEDVGRWELCRRSVALRLMMLLDGRRGKVTL